MQNIYKDLMLLEDEQEEQEKDLILDMINSLTHFYVEEEDGTSKKVPWYCMLSDVASDFGYSDKEMMDFAKNHDFIVFKISPIGSFEGGLAIADKDIDLDIVKENVRKSVVDDFEEEKDIPEVKISFEKDRKVEESKLDDLKVSSYKYLLDVYDRDDNFIERKFFRSRPEADKFVDAMEDLFDIKISNNEVVELKDGKDFFGTYWKVIRDLEKNESLKEDIKEVPWILQQGEDGEPEYIGFAKSQNDMIDKMVKNHSSNSIGENTYIDELDKDTYEYMKKDGDLSEDDIKMLDKYFNVEESLEIKEFKEELNKLGFEIALREDNHQHDYKMITKEGNQTSDSFNGYIDRLEEVFENFRERTGYSCVFNVGLQNDGHIICEVDINESLKEEKEDYQKKFNERTHAHIDRVNKYAKKIDKEYPNHDSDKFNELYEGYSLMSKENVSEEEQALIDDATFKHVRDNEHHCEHWVDEKDIEGFSRNNTNPHGCLDCSKMPNEALEEMCCDWCAMSEEFNNTPFEWYEKNKDTRWHFNEEQDKFIQETLHKLWDEDLEEDIEKHDELNPKLFDNEELKPAVAKAIMNIANEFVKELGEDGISFTLKDVILLGSNMSYNYTKDSDLDIHLIADSSALECPKELQDKLYGAYRTIFNKNYDITIKGIPAEVYVEMDEPQAKSNGIYSLNSGWVKKPEQQAIPNLDKEAFDKEFKVWEDRYNELINNENATSEDVEEYINDIYDERKDGIANDGEYSLGNLLFKEVRNKGYLDNLKDLRKELKGKELSLEHLEEEVVNDDEAFWNIRNKISDVISDKYDEVNLIIDDGEIRPITKDELKNKFAVSVEHADSEDYKSKEEIENIAKDINAEKIMFFVYKGQFGGEYSFLVNDENVARDVANKYNQESYAKFDDNGNYQEIKTKEVDKKLNNAYNKRELEYFKHENLRVKRR